MAQKSEKFYYKTQVPGLASNREWTYWSIEAEILVKDGSFPIICSKNNVVSNNEGK